MIGKFTKSRFGQIIIISATVATVTTAIIAGFYEKIRIPTLAERLSSKDDRIKIVENDLQKEVLVSANWKTIADQATNEVAAFSRKLANLRDDYLLLVERERITALQAATNANLLVTSNTQGQRIAINLRQTILSVGDQENLGFYAVDKIVDGLETISSAKWGAEMNEFELRIPKKLATADVWDFAFGLGLRIGNYTSFRIRLGELRAFMTKRILEHYRGELLEAERHPPEVFYERIRNKPDIIPSLASLQTTLLGNTNATGWNSNALVAVRSFVESNGDAPMKK